jgi:hypothetical protein
MSAVIGRRFAGGLLVVPLALLVAACGQPAAAPRVPVGQTSQPVSTEPGEIELSEPQATFTEPNRVRFEVKYRFTKGKPDKYYLCEVSFPGTPNHAAKPMESCELKSEGVIKDTVVLSKPPVKAFEIRMSEADSPQNGYTKISNVIGGPVE